MHINIQIPTFPTKLQFTSENKKISVMFVSVGLSCAIRFLLINIYKCTVMHINIQFSTFPTKLQFTSENKKSVMFVSVRLSCTLKRW